MKALLFVLSMTLMGIFYFVGEFSGKLNEREQIKSQILQNQYAPGTVSIGDSTYLVRYYPLTIN